MKLIKKIILSIFDIFVTVPFGLLFCIKCYRNDRNKHILIANSIGDVFYTLGFLKEYVDSNHITNYVIHITNKQEQLCEIFKETLTNLHIISNKKHQLLVRFFSTSLGFKFICKSKSLLVVHPGIYFRNTFQYISRHPNVSFASFIKYSILGLGEKDDFNFPEKISKDIVNNLIRKYEVKKNCGVILCPYAKSIEPIPIIFYEELTEKLVEKGYTVFTNATKEEKEIKGTIRISLEFQQMLAFLEHCGNIIGLRSGILDLALLADAKIIALYPKDNIMQQFYDIASIINKSNVTQLNISDNYIEDVRYICELL